MSGAVHTPGTIPVCECGKPSPFTYPCEDCAAHTPGPWVAHNAPGVLGWRVESDAPGYPNDGWHVACELMGSDAEANARLIAAAPELVEALRDAHDKLHECTAVLSANDAAEVADTMAQVRAALHKAGVTP